MPEATAVREKPIMFSGLMVKSILEGRKTMIRRIMKPQPQYHEQQPHWRWKPKRGPGNACGPFAVASGDYPGMFAPWEPSDHLWVRETWQPARDGDSGKTISIYRADWEANGSPEGPPGGKWRRPIYMPRGASRITLELTDVRVEQLGDMTAKDVVAEGFPFSSDLDQFKLLWKKINGEWNPETWTWVLSFKRVEVAHA